MSMKLSSWVGAHTRARNKSFTEPSHVCATILIKSAVMTNDKKIIDVDEIIRLGTNAERYGYNRSSADIRSEVVKIIDEKLAKFSVRPII
jgi:hypothetical protein